MWVVIKTYGRCGCLTPPCFSRLFRAGEGEVAVGFGVGYVVQCVVLLGRCRMRFQHLSYRFLGEGRFGRTPMYSFFCSAWVVSDGRPMHGFLFCLGCFGRTPMYLFFVPPGLFRTDAPCAWRLKWIVVVTST